MSGDRHEKILQLYGAAQQLAGDARSEFLNRECAGDEALCAELICLLDRDIPDGFLEFSALGPEFSILDPTTWEDGDELPERIASYKILGRIGAGGMSIVYRAEQDNPRRVVALKVLPAAMPSPDHHRRFQREIAALADLNDPRIVAVYDAGVTKTAGGRQLYVAMQYIEGDHFIAYAAKHNLSLRQRLELMASLCDAIHHAHQNGIIHRDLKPANILVTTRNGSAHPYVLDFGVSRLIGDDRAAITILTQQKQLVGTLTYMSPEQVAGEQALDVRTDVYSLGVLLYELLTGRRPVDLKGRSLIEAVGIVRDAQPQAVGAIDTRLRGDVETIVAKALDRDKNRRYPSAAEMAADIRRHLNHEPIQARPPALSYTLGKLVRRHRAFMGFLGVVLAILVVASAVSIYYGTAAMQARDAEAAEAKKARELLRLQSDILFNKQPAIGAMEVETRAHSTLLSGASRALLGRADTTIEEMLDVLVSHLSNGAIEDEGTLAHLRHDAGERYLQLQRPEKALQQFDAALTHSAALSEHERLVFALNRAIGLQMLGRHQEVIDSLGSVSERLATMFGSSDTLALKARRTIASSMHARAGRSEGASEVKKHMEETIDIARRTYGEAHQEYALALYEYALNQWTQNDWNACLENLRRSVEILSNTLGADAPETQLATTNLANRLTIAKSPDEAVELARENLARMEQVLGFNHRALDGPVYTLAQALVGSTNAAPAEILEILDRGIELDARFLPGLYELKGRVLRRLKRFDEAAKAWERATLLLRNAGKNGDLHPLQVVMHARAEALFEAEEYEESLAAWREFIDFLRVERGVDEWSRDLVVPMMRIGEILDQQGEQTEAEAALLKSFEISERADSRKGRLWSSRLLAGHYRNRGEEEQAECWQSIASENGD